MTQDVNNNKDNLDPCPDAEVLKAYSEGGASEAVRSIVESHLEFCASCRSKMEDMGKPDVPVEKMVGILAHRLKQRQQQILQKQAQGPVLGTIWRTVPASEQDLYGPMVIVIDENKDKADIVQVAEISEDIPQAIETDMILQPTASGLSFRCMVRTGNIFCTDKKNLKTFAGRLSPSLTTTVVRFCKTQYYFNDKVPFSEYVFVRDQYGNELMRRRGVTSGMLVTKDDDSRLNFLEESKQRCSYLDYDQEMSGFAVAPEEEAARSGAQLLDLGKARRAKAGQLKDAVVKYAGEKFRSSLVKKLWPIAAMILVAVVTAKTTQLVIEKEKGEASRIMLGAGVSGLRERPRSQWIVGGRSLEVVDVPLKLPQQESNLVSDVLLRRMNESVGTGSPYYVTPSRDPLFDSLSYAFYKTDRLNHKSANKVGWCCDSLLIPITTDDNQIVYGVSWERLIGIAMEQPAEEMSGAFTKATVSWSLRLLRGKQYKELALLFAGSHNQLYQNLADEIDHEIQGAGHIVDTPGYWADMISEIVARYPDEAASLSVLSDYGMDLNLPFAEIMITTLMTMEAFPELANRAVFGESPLVPVMYEKALERLREALRKAYGSNYENAKIHKREEIDRLSRQPFWDQRTLSRGEDSTPNDWITLRAPSLSGQ